MAIRQHGNRRSFFRNYLCCATWFQSKFKKKFLALKTGNKTSTKYLQKPLFKQQLQNGENQSVNGWYTRKVKPQFFVRHYYLDLMFLFSGKKVTIKCKKACFKTRKFEYAQRIYLEVERESKYEGKKWSWNDTSIRDRNFVGTEKMFCVGRLLL